MKQTIIRTKKSNKVNIKIKLLKECRNYITFKKL